MTNMNRTTTLSIFLLLACTGMAQQNYKRPHNRMLDDAKLLLAQGEYPEAAKIYKRLLPVDPEFAEVQHELALCYLGIPGQLHRATPYLERAVELGHTESHYHLALARHREHRFEEAIDLLVGYKQLFRREVADLEVDRRITMAQDARQQMQHPVEMEIRNMGPRINSPAHDYSPLVTADGNTMYFTSRREGTTGGLKDATGQYLEDIYVAHRENGIWRPARNAGPPLNTAVHDATVGISADGRTLIMYRTSRDLVAGDLYEVRMQPDGTWGEPELMTERINSSAHEPSATISPDGSEVYFTSDRPGGYGGRDLYRIRRLPNGKWSLPLNLGPKVNTPYDEDAPFMHSDGITLFFSSNGHRTMGGYDIFKTTLVDPDMNGWSTPENMGHPLNTVNDDIYFSLSADGTTGYFSSEREGGLGAQDIYMVEFPNDQLDYVLVHGVVTDIAEHPQRARITLIDEATADLHGVYNTNERTGRYVMVLSPGARYLMTVESEGFTTQESVLEADAPDGTRERLMDILVERPSEHERLTRNERER